MDIQRTEATVLAIIVTYNGMQWIEKSIASLVASACCTNILVVDNSSTDGTVEYIKNHFPQVEVIESKENLGFGKANNIGLSRAISKRYDYSFLLNQDAWIETNTISQLIELHRTTPEYVLLAPLQLNGDGTLIDKLFNQYSVAPCREMISDFMLHPSEVKAIYSTPFLNGACWLLPLETVSNFGGFDPLYPHYGEDVDYINRIVSHGKSIGLCPKVNVFHDRENRPETSNIQKQRVKCYIDLLIRAKSPNQALKSTLYYRLLYLKTALVSLLTNNRTHNRCMMWAIKEIINKRDVIKLHRENETILKAHYL